MDEPRLYATVLWAVFAAAPVIFVSLLFVPAPYGRHARSGFGPTLPSPLLWALMESPSIFAFLFFYARGPHPLEPGPLILLALWQAHYLGRSILDPLRMRGRGGREPVLIALLAIVYNVANSYLNAKAIAGPFGRPLDAEWLRSPAFVLGVVLFGLGFWLNRDSDARLRRLEEHAAGGYGLPTGGGFAWVSCPNYLGEMVQWCGWTLASGSLAGLSFAVFTAANLVPRALAHHRFYRRRFPDYPAERRAVLPLLL